MPEEVNKAAIERGRRLRDALADPDSDLTWLLAQAKEQADRAEGWALRDRILPDEVSREHCIGKRGGLLLLKVFVEDAIETGRREAEKLLEQKGADNRESGPQEEKTAPDRG